MYIYLLQALALTLVIPLVFGDLKILGGVRRAQSPDELPLNLAIGGIVILCGAVITPTFTNAYSVLYRSGAHLENESLWLQFVIALVAIDFLAYVHHLCLHAWPALWASHIVHHQSQSINLSAGLREHPFVMISRFVFLSPLLLLGVSPAVFATALGTIGFYVLFTHRSAIHHSPSRTNAFGFIFNLPAYHRMHHRADAPYTRCNFGLMLIIWDRLFGTFAEPCEHNERYGVIGVNSTEPLSILLWSKWAAILSTSHCSKSSTEDGRQSGLTLTGGVLIYMGSAAAALLISWLLRTAG